MNSMPENLLFLVDDDVQSVVTLSNELRSDPRAGVKWKWCDTLKELYDDLQGCKSSRCVVLLDSFISLMGVEEVTKEALGQSHPSLVQLMGKPELSGLLFAAVIKELCPDAWIILHSAYAEPIRQWREALSDLDVFAHKTINDWVWKPGGWEECLAAIERGLTHGEGAGTCSER